MSKIFLIVSTFLMCCFCFAVNDTTYVHEDSLIKAHNIDGPPSKVYLEKNTERLFNGWVIKKNEKFLSIFRVADGHLDGEFLGYKRIKGQYRLIYYLHYSRGYLKSDCHYNHSTGGLESIQLYAALGIFDDQNMDSKYISYSEKKKSYSIMEVYKSPKRNQKGSKLKFTKYESNEPKDSIFYHAYIDKPYYFPRVINDEKDLPRPPKKYEEFGKGLFAKGFVPTIKVAIRE